MLHVRKDTTAIIRGQVKDANGVPTDITGWAMRLVGLGTGAGFLKTNDDAEQIAFTDAENGWYEAYLTLTDTAVARFFPVQLRAQEGSSHYLLAGDVLFIAA